MKKRSIMALVVGGLLAAMLPGVAAGQTTQAEDYVWDGRLASDVTRDYVWDGRLASSYTPSLALTN